MSITGYCPACGRGDAAPTADDWEQQRQRADRAEAELRDRVHADSADAAAGSYARRAEQAEQEAADTATAAAMMVSLVRERAERAEAALERVRGLAAQLEEFAENALRADDRKLYAAIANDLRKCAGEQP
jgi:hypothetical protein